MARSGKDDVDAAVAAAVAAQGAWAATPAVQRGLVLHRICNALEAHQQELAEIVARETGKSPKEAFGETGGAIALGRFFAGEGQRLYGRTTTSGTPDKYAMTVRQPCGVAGLDHRREHADRQRRVEGVPGADLRQRRRAQGGGGHAWHVLAVRQDRA